MEAIKFIIRVDLICKNCAIGNCTGHVSKKILIDKETGLKVEARCICKNHK